MTFLLNCVKGILIGSGAILPGIIECWWALEEFDTILPCSCEGGREVRTVLLSSVRMTSGIGPRHSLETEDEPRWSKVH